MKLNRHMKKSFLILLVFSAIAAKGQEKEYHLGHHAVSVENNFAYFLGLQLNYHYIINPKDRFMWMPKVSVGYSPYEPWPYYDWGLDMAFGDKNRLVLGLGGAYIGPIDYKMITGDVRYLNYGKKHLFFFLTYRVNYEYQCECDDIGPFSSQVRVAIGWKF